jgi:hypothetical protein
LSKSQFIKGLQCHKFLWLYRHRYELRTEPDASQQSIFDIGTDVGDLARQLFPGGYEIVYGSDKIDANVQKTRDLIDSGTETIYEASFIYEDILVMVDILHRGADGWEMYEVKSSASVKPLHVNDVSVQYYVLRGTGLSISRASLVHVNSKYVRHGELDLGQLFTIADMTEAVIDHQPFVKDQLCLLRDMLDGDEPAIDIGPHCSKPYQCDFREHCWQHIPEKSVFSLVKLGSKKQFALYDKGIIKLEDIPIDSQLGPAQRIQLDAELGRGHFADKTEFIDSDAIKTFLSLLEEPIGFLDFETFMEAVPSFDNQRPYLKIPFQYSLDVLTNGELEHFEFLGQPDEDPRQEFVERMIADTKACRSIVVYNATFEKGIIKKLISTFPDRAGDLQGIVDMIVDQMKPFEYKQYYTKAMKGYWSIKVVLPALVPELSYSDLDISDGGMAMISYANMRQMTDKAEIAKTRSDLLKYCGLDTLAMVKIIGKMKTLV